MVVIGLVGKKQSGKSTVAKAICEVFNAKELAFATKLKNIASLLLDVPITVFEDNETKEIPLPDWNITPREVLQRLGTDIGQQIHKNIWVTPVLKRINVLSTIFSVIVVSDVRFQHEANALRQIGGILVRVVKDSENVSYDAHSSEIEQDYIKCNYELRAKEGDVQSLKRQACDLIYHLLRTSGTIE